MKRVVVLLALAVCGEGLCCTNFKWHETVKKFITNMVHGKNYMKEFDEINIWLVLNIRTQDPSQNLVAVRVHFLGAAIGHPLRMVEAATQLVSIADDSFLAIKCTPEAVKILKANMASSRNPDAENSKRRIDQIVLHYLRQHAIDCNSVYPEKADAATNHYASPSASRVLAFVNSGLSMWVEAYFENDQSSLNGRHHIPSSSVVEFIESRVSGSTRPYKIGKTGRRYFHKQRIEALVVEHIFDPCEEFVTEVSDVMVPCLFDDQIQPHNYRLSEYRHFVESVVGYHWCGIALRERKSLMDSIHQDLARV